MKNKELISNNILPFNGTSLSASYDNRALYYCLWLQGHGVTISCAQNDIHNFRIWLDVLDDFLDTKKDII
jgi:hypothetical protein